MGPVVDCLVERGGRVAVRDALSRITAEGIVDMVAVARFVKGDDVTLTAEERRLAIHAARAAGQSIDTIAKRHRVHDRKVKDELSRPFPVDTHRRPLTLNIKHVLGDRQHGK